MNDSKQQTRGNIKIKFDEQEEETSLFEYESMHAFFYTNLYLVYLVKKYYSKVVPSIQKRFSLLVNLHH